MSIPLQLVCILLAVATAAPTTQDPGFPPFHIRKQATGCWAVGKGITLTLSEYGKHNLRATTRFPESQRYGLTPAVVSDQAHWLPHKGAFQVTCRPYSRHGSFCLVVPMNQGLQVYVYAIRYGTPHVGHLVDSFIAARCQ